MSGNASPKAQGKREARDGVGCRGRMRDHAVIVHRLLTEHRRISLARIAEELDSSELTARRWVDSFSSIIPLRLERGVVVTDLDD